MRNHEPHDRTRAAALGALTAAVALVAVNGSVRAGIAGIGASGIQFHNVGASAVDLELSLRHEAGDPPVTIRRTGIGPQQAANVYVPLEVAMRNGAYAATVLGSADLVPLSRVDWSSSRASVLTGGSRSATAVSVPWVRNDGAAFETLVSVQNTNDAASASITVRAIRSGSAEAAVTVPFTIGAGGSITLDLGRHTAFAGLRPFDGAIAIDADQPVAASVLVDGVASPMGVAGYAAPTATEASAVLLLPYVPIDAVDAVGRRWRADLGLHNPTPHAAEATVAVEGVGACDGDDHVGRITVAPGGAARVDLGPAATGIAAGCTAVARIDVDGEAAVTGALVAHGTDADGSVQSLVGYAAIPLADARDDLAAPLWRNDHTPWRQSSHLYLHNPGPATVEATIELRNNTGDALPCPDGCTFDVPPGGVAVPAGIGGAMPARAYGSARVRASGALVGIVVDAAQQADSAAIALISTADIGRRWVPLVLRGGAPAGRPTDVPPTPLHTQAPLPIGTPVAWPAPAPGAGPMGAAASGLVVFNRASQASALRLAFWPAVGEVRTVEIGNVPPAITANVFLPTLTDLSNDSYLASVDSDDFAAPMLRTDWVLSGAALAASTSPADDHIVLPLGLRATERALVRVGNPSNSGDAAGTVDFGAGPTPITVVPGRFVTLRAPSGARVADVRMDRPVVASAIVFDAAASRVAYDVAGRGEDDASTERWIVRAHRAAPLVDAHDVTRSTRAIVANPSSAAVDVTATLQGDGGACGGQSFAVRPHTVPAGDAIVIDLADAPGVPSGCSGPLKLSGSGPFVANGIDSYLTGGLLAAAAAAPAVAPAEASDGAWLPFVRYAHTPLLFATDVSVVNPGASPRTVTLSAIRNDGAAVSVADASVVLPPGGGHVYRAAAVLRSLVGSYASGRIAADGPVVVRVDDYAASGRADATALVARSYRAQPSPPLGERHILWAERGASVDLDPGPPPPPPAPTPTPAPPLTLLTVALVNVAGGPDGACPACDGVYDAADRAAAVRSPLPQLRFVAEDSRGRRLAVTRSTAVDGIQVGAMSIAAADANGIIVVRVEGLDAAWTPCPNASTSREVTIKDFALGTARLDFHFSNSCTPTGAPLPLVPASLPELPPRLGRHDLFVPFALAQR